MRARALYVRAFGGLLLIAGCAAPPPPTSGTPADEAAIRSMGNKYAEAWNKGDVATLASMVTDDYEAVDPDGAVVKGRVGAEAREKAAAAQRAGANLKLSIDTVLLKWVGANAAAVGGTWSLAGAPPESGPTKGAWSTLVVKGADDASYLTVDGQVGVDLRSQDRVRVSSSPNRVHLIQPQRMRFFEVLRNKMKWGER